jgi:hypothetical protein
MQNVIVRFIQVCRRRDRYPGNSPKTLIIFRLPEKDMVTFLYKSYQYKYFKFETVSSVAI